MKTCSKCRDAKSLDAFYKNSRLKDGYCVQCKTCMLADRKAWYLKNKDHVRAYSKTRTKADRRKIMLKHNYGISVEQYDWLSGHQDGKCAICRSTTADAKGSPLYVDHCHTTNKIRGLLCDTCNKGLGNFKDRPDLLSAAIDYLQETL